MAEIVARRLGQVRCVLVDTTPASELRASFVGAPEVSSTAYSRRGVEVGVAAGDGGHHPSCVVGGHPRGEVGGGVVVGLLLVAPPFHEQAVGQAREDAMHPYGVAVAQPALIVAAGDVQPGVQAGFDAPVLPVEPEPAGGAQGLGRPAGDQRHGFGGPSIHFAAQPRALGGQRKAGGFGRDLGGVDRAGLGAAFVAFVGAGQGRGRFRGGKTPEGPGRPVPGSPARSAGCL